MSKRSLGSIKTIAVVDLETNCLPGYAGNRTCAITELSLYAFSATNFRGVDIYEKVGIANLGLRKPPVLPRALHKLTVMINPGRPMSPEAANITGLTNAMLVDEATFDRNAANCLLTFLERLEKPICLLAHNGSKFDFPVMRYVFRRLDMTIPSTIYCMDTFTVFREIDEKQTLIKRMKEKLLEVEKSSSSGECKTEMEKRLNDLAMYRTLFLHKFRPTPRYPRKGTYVLGNIFKRVFGQPAEHLHRAEADVEILTKIILHYGLPFLACVEERKQSFGEVTDLRPLI